MDEEKSISKLDNHLGKKIQVIAFGTSYLGTLRKVDYEKGYLILSDGKEKVILELERVESFTPVDP